jgi:predicted nucleotidyltransferase component of viral defense system
VKLYEHPDFKDAISAAKDHFDRPGLTEQFVEKDYYVTEALRIIANTWQDRIIFKGGTSLSKAWNLIERFSEDIDLYLNKNIADPPLGSNQIDRTLKDIQKAVEDYPNFRFLSSEKNGRSRSSRGISRTGDFAYEALFSDNQDIPDRILLEMGIRSGNYPVETKDLLSLLALFLTKTNESLGAEDEVSFPMQVLHFRRTFVEKIFAIHSHVIHAQQRNQSIETYARHYYDLFCLSQQEEVIKMMNSDEFLDIKNDCNLISQTYFNTMYHPPENLSFANSKALFPTQDVRPMIMEAYGRQSKNLCYGKYPSWEEVEACFEKIRALL